jgi:cell division transport system permease protein
MVLAMSTVLVLLGIYALVLLQGRGLLRDLRERVTVVVEVRPAITSADREAFKEWLEGSAFAKTGSVTFVSKEDGARKLREQFGEDFMDFGLENPLYELFTFNVAEAFVNPESLQAVKTELQAQDASLAVYVEEDVARSLSQRVSALAWAGIVLGAFLLLAVIFLIVNTTRLALLSQAQLIKNMELVGASWGFISRPFLLKSIRLGSLAGLIAALATLGCSYALQQYLPSIWQPLSILQISIIALGLIVIGLLVNFASTFVVVRNTLKLRVDDLAAL